MKTVNVGVAGIGFMGATHIKSYLNIPGARIAAICDAVRLPVDGDLSAIGGNLGDGRPFKLDMTQVKTYSKFDELLANPEIDLIDLCVPTPPHRADSSCPRWSCASGPNGRGSKKRLTKKPSARRSPPAFVACPRRPAG